MRQVRELEKCVVVGWVGGTPEGGGGGGGRDGGGCCCWCMMVQWFPASRGVMHTSGRAPPAEDGCLGDSGHQAGPLKTRRDCVRAGGTKQAQTFSRKV